MFGLINVNKPAGPTSHDLVARIRKMLPRGGGRSVKVGHAGTLDPFADGVLVICVGPATRLAQYVQRQPKRYTAQITLGATSTTDDPEGQLTDTPGHEPPSDRCVGQVLRQLVGRIEQIPPAYSAIHVNGRRAYKLARQGERPELQAREVNIISIEQISYDWPRLVIDVRCGSGTYIRALARDIGSALAVGGYCSGLTRTEVGPFTVDSAVAVDEIALGRDLLSPMAALAELPQVIVDPAQALRLANGNPIELSDPINGQEVAVLDQAGRLLAIATVDSADRPTLRPTKVFIEPRIAPQ